MVASPRHATSYSRHLLRSAAALLGLGGLAAGVAGIGAVPASAAGRPAVTNLCAAATGAQVSAIVGFKVPNGIGSTNTLAPTKKNDGIGDKSLSCIYGSFTSEAALKKDVGLGYETFTRSLTPADFQKFFTQANSIKGLKISTYDGGFYFTFAEDGIHAEGLALFSGSHSSEAFVYTSTVSKAKLAQLAQLASKL